MKALFADGTLIGLILAGMLAEAVILVVFHRISRRGIAPAAVLLNLCSGMGLLLAMRLLLAGAWWGWASLSLLTALGFHVADLTRLWRAPTGLKPLADQEKSVRLG